MIKRGHDVALLSRSMLVSCIRNSHKDKSSRRAAERAKVWIGSILLCTLFARSAALREIIRVDVRTGFGKRELGQEAQ